MEVPELIQAIEQQADHPGVWVGFCKYVLPDLLR